MVEDSYSLEESLIDNLLNFAVTPKVSLPGYTVWIGFVYPSATCSYVNLI